MSMAMLHSCRHHHLHVTSPGSAAQSVVIHVCDKNLASWLASYCLSVTAVNEWLVSDARLARGGDWCFTALNNQESGISG